jgi:methionyl-tRNA formyltransferase
VAELAHDAGLPLLQPERIEEAVDEISLCDALVVAAYGRILRSESLHAARYGAWNVHGSLLPLYRGAAPVERAILAGEEETGVTIIRMDEGLDTGPMALKESTVIGEATTGGELTQQLAEMGGKAVVETLSLLEEGSLDLTEQDDSRASYAAKISSEDRVVSWREGAREVHDRIRALSPHIGARTSHADYQGQIKFLRSRVSRPGTGSLGPGEICTNDGRLMVGCGEGEVEVLELQAPGARPMKASEFLRGRDLQGAFQS